MKHMINPYVTTAPMKKQKYMYHCLLHLKSTETFLNNIFIFYLIFVRWNFLSFSGRPFESQSHYIYYISKMSSVLGRFNKCLQIMTCFIVYPYSY